MIDTLVLMGNPTFTTSVYALGISAMILGIVGGSLYSPGQKVGEFWRGYSEMLIATELLLGIEVMLAT